jgi:hypothetical protein
LVRARVGAFKKIGTQFAGDYFGVLVDRNSMFPVSFCGPVR